MKDNDVDTRGLEALAPSGGVPPPRRNDAAFARAVKDGVHKRRTRWLFAFPALVGATAALAFVVLGRGGDVEGVADAGPTLAVAEPGVRAPAVAWGLDEIGIGADFAIPSLEGSSDEELARFDAALDAALAKRGFRG